MKIKIVKKSNTLAEEFANPTIESEIEFRKLMVVEGLLQHMKHSGITRSELAKRMGVGPSRITAMLDGSSNLTIETLVRAGRAVGADLQQTYVPHGQQGHWVKTGPICSHTHGVVKVDFRPDRVESAPSPVPVNNEHAENDVEDAA